MRLLNLPLIGHEWLLRLFFGLISYVAIVTVAAECIDGKTYSKLDDRAISQDAITGCQNVGATLVTPRSMEALQNIEDATQVEEFWINLFNNNGFDCKDNACQSGKLTTNDGQTISLGVFDEVEIKDDERCIKSKKTDIRSNDCDDEFDVVCEKNCQTAATMTASPNPAPCHNMGSVQSNENQKFYKAVDSPGGYQSAHEACAASDMELADISTDEGIKAIHETLGSGPFWLSTYNPSAKDCTTPTSCYSTLRNGYGSYIQYYKLSSNMDINITTARCVQVTCNSGSIKLESLDCQSTPKVACESSCALQTKGAGYNRCPIPPVGPHPIIYETSPRSFEAGSTRQLRYTCNDGFRFKDTNSDTQNTVCQADGTWSDVGTCERFACMDTPLDKSTDNINSNASQTLTNHLMGIKIEYKCKDGFFYEDDQSLTEKYATCDQTKGNFTYPEPFGKCVESKTCSQKPPGTETVATTVGAVFKETFSNDYDSSKTYNNDDIVTYKCKSELDEAFKGTVKVGEIKSTCQWDETWSLTDENLKDYECKLNLCDISQLKDQEANAGTLTLETQTHVSFNENGIFKCPEGQLRVDDPTTAEFQVLCESTGNFKLPASWPTCADASDLVIDFSTIRYTCDEGFAFPDETNEKTITCGTDGQWTPSEPGNCSRVACDGEPPIPMASLNLIRQDWESGKFAKFGTSVSYQCKPYTQVAEGITHFNLTCTDNQDKGVFIGEYYNSTLPQPFGACLEVATCPPPDAIENTVQKRNPYFSEWSNPGYWKATYSEAPNIITSPAFAIDGKIDPQNPEVKPFAANGNGSLTIDLVENFIIEKVRVHFKESSTSKMLQVGVSVSSHSNQPCGSTGDKAPPSTHEFVCNIPYIGSKLKIVKSSPGPLAIDEILVIGTRFSVPMDAAQLSVQPENAPKEKQFKLILGDEGSPHVVYGVGFTLARDQAPIQESEFPSVEVTITNQGGAKCQSTTHPGFAGEQLVVCDDSVEATELTIALETSDSILTSNFFVRLVGWKDEARGSYTCYEIFSKGLTAPGWYFLGRSNEKRSYAFCSDMQTRILRRLQSGNDKDAFNKELEAYQSGFKENEEYFIGFDFMDRSSTWHKVDASIRMKDTFGREKRINMDDLALRNSLTWFDHPWSIGVFRILDVLSMHNMIPLATLDQPDAAGCVASLNAPGWFRNDSNLCAYANPFGTNLNSHEAEAGKGIFFSSFRGFSNSLAELEFSIFSGMNFNSFSPSTQSIMTTFKTEVEYHCPDGMSFTDDSGSDITPKLTLTCQWSGSYSRSHEGDLKCAYTHCTDPPIDDRNLVTTNWDGQKVPVGGVVQYRCIDGMKFNHNRSLEYVEINCQTGNKYSEVPTVECVHNITCPQLVEPPNDLEKGNLVVSNRGTLFGTCIGNQAFQQFQSTPGCPELEVYVYDEKYQSEHEVISIVELKANLSGEAGFFGAEVIFSHEVLTDTIVSDDLVKFEQGTNQRHLRLTFMADKLKGQTSTLKAKYKPILSETLCIYDATCYKTQEEMDQASSLSTLGGTFDPSQSLMRVESVVNYTCGGSSAFEGSTDDVTISSIVSTCQLDGTWDNPLVNEGLPKCKWVSCNVPVGAEHNLNASEWNGEPIPFYTQLNYFCPNGGKFKESFELESQNATCLPENKWITPSEWLECSKEAQCPTPPAEPINGEVVVLHGGRIYDDQQGEPFDLDAGELGMANFNWTDTVFLSTLVIHSANLEIKDHKSDFHAFLIFSSDASPADILAKSEAGKMRLKTTSAPNILSLHKTESKENVSTVVIELNINQKIQKTTPGRVLVLDPIIELVKIVGQACSGAEDCDKKQNDFNLFEHFQPTHHAAHLNYKCPLAFWFEPKNVTEQEITCNWNKTWSESIPECVPYGCAHPPKPDATLNITMDTFPEDKVFDFGANVTYTCKSGHKFDDDFLREKFELTCQRNGSFTNHLPWNFCIKPSDRTCHDPPEPKQLPNIGGATYDWDNTSLANNGTIFGTIIAYRCEIARGLHDPVKSDVVENQEIECLWNHTYAPTKIFDCKWTACINPMNQTQRNLTHDFVEGSTISFGSFLTYTCIEGHFFDADYHQTEFKVECKNTGFFQYPANDTLWPRCLPTKFCPSHPEKPRRARIHWNKDLEHQAKATFFCWPNFAAKDPNGDLINVTESTCQWNRTWADVDLQCKPSHCPVIPVPTTQSGLIYKPKEETTSPNASWLSDMLYYNKSVPLTIPIPADFGKDLILVIDGRFVESSPIQVMEIKILDVENNSLANFSLNALTEHWTPGSDALGVMLYERTNISAGDAFRFQMRFLPAQNSFEMLLMDGSAPISINRVDTGEPNGLVIIDGDITLNLAGFTTAPNETRLMVGDELKFACEQGLVFTGDEFVKPELNLKCETSGLVSGAPETWPICARRGAPRIMNCVQGDCPIPTSEDENVIVTLPTSNPALGPVEFPFTTRYHWPNFDLNATDPSPEDFEVVSGPNLFKEAVELKQGHDKCLIDKEFAFEGDTCIRNPVNCEDGFSFSLFFKPNYDLEPHQFFNASKTFFQQYIVSTGGDRGSPGFGIFIQGGDIGAVVSTGNLTWQVQVKGGAPDNKTWTNLAIKWKPALFNNQDELQDLLTVQKKKFHELGGLQLYRNLELIGQTFHPDEDVFGSDGEQFEEPEIMIGCHRTPQDDTARKFSHGTYDELAFWARALNSSEEAFFLGGYQDVFEDVGTDDLLKILNFIDYADVNQADTAINIMESIVNGEEEEEEEFRNIYPETTPTPSDTTEEENGSTSTTLSSTTTPTAVPKKDPTKDVKNLMKIAKKLTGTGSLNYYITKREFDVRMKAVSPLGEFMGIKGKYAEGWTALKKDKNEAGPFETLTNLKNYVKYNIERYTVIPPESKLRETRRVVTSNNFAMEAFKMSSTNFGKLGTAHTNGYFKFPNWNTPEWTRAKASFGYTQSQDRPTESVDISSELFTEECKKKDINFVGMISDTFPDHGRKNPSSIFANHIELDSRVITLDITANQLDTEPESPTVNKFSERCEIDPKLAIKDPFIITFAIKSKRNHDFGRKLTSYYDSFDDKRVTNRHCVIWNEDIGPFGAWDTRGVTLVKADDAQATCYATKLGIYAIVAEIEDVPHAEDDETWLNIVKFIGYAVSIILLLIFIGVVLSSTYLWEMFHLIAVNMAFCLLFGHIFMLISEVNGIRDDRDSCSAIGLLILFFYSGLSVFITMECYAMFKAIISGIIGGHTRTYLCFGYGVPLFHMGLSIYLHLQEMGTDPRCMVGWANEVKEAFYIPVAIFGILSVCLITIIVCNINTPAMRKESMVEELGSLAKGLGVFVLLYGLTWSWFPFAYMRFPTHEFPDFYPAFQVMNAFMGMFFFVFIGLMSNRFRTALTGGILMRRKALLADASADDNYKEQVDDDTITTMDDLEHGDDDEEEDIEAAPRSRPVSGKSAKQELSEEVDPPEEEILSEPNEDDIPIIPPETEDE